MSLNKKVLVHVLPLSVLLTGTPHNMAPEVSADKRAVAKLAAAIAPASAFLRSPLDL